MRATVHASMLEADITITATAEILPTAIKPVPDREWIATPNDSDRRGYFKPTGHDLKDANGRTLYSLPVNASTLDGHIMRNVYFRVRGLAAPLPPLTYLRPTGEVEVTFSSSGQGSLTIVSDSMEPITEPLHKAA